MRCLYCRPEGLANACTTSQLSVQEIHTLVQHLAQHHGLKKVRLTGGEPTVRADLPDIIACLADIPQIRELALTTNGLTLSRQAARYAQAGLQRVNISLDSLDPDTFGRMTGVHRLEQVLEGIDAAVACGLNPVKLNAVVVKGINDHQLVDLVRFAARRKLEIRFIELMPMGPLADRWEERFVTESRMRQILSEAVADWQPQPMDSSSARSYIAHLIDGQQARIGFITAMSCPFCQQCDRIRIGADGMFFPCLMDQPAGSLLPALRPVFDASRLNQLLATGLAGKAPAHPAVGVGIMTHIGG